MLRVFRKKFAIRGAQVKVLVLKLYGARTDYKLQTYYMNARNFCRKGQNRMKSDQSPHY